MMRAFSLAEASAWAGASSRAGDLTGTRYTGVSTDTRSLSPGDLFVALRGENFDGHRFLSAARDAGAVAAVVDVEDDSVDLPQLVVGDTVQALARLAAGNRDASTAELVAVTGSSGKTTVREMTGAILSTMGPTLVTEGNLNNHIGVPLTLFRLAPEHRYGAIELGASGLGEIAHTVAITRPQVVILTNAGQAHLEGFGSYQNIVLAKGEIIEGVTEGGLVVLNRDDPAFDQWLNRAGDRRVVSVSRLGHPDADYRVTDVSVARDGQALTVAGPDNWQCRLTVPLPGDHNQINALLAIAATRDLGASDAQIREGLENVRPVSGRLQSLELSDRLTVIDDSYNANPASMKAALAVLAGREGRLMAVFGAMAELGEQARELHAEVGACARELGIDRLLVVGPGCEGYADGFGQETETFEDHETAVNAVVKGLNEPTTVLVKGSRSSAMDRVVEGIKEKVNDACCSG
ncbi:UDP-N-acetylmuramoyl-tripeptide--D-alanyl-D-alanine ligase [Marinobacter santoriniensis NKSG1]|uniref:UDP-N-acetylmuramoyl-tripeptide--D-alanyl-D-alanine ligase n=1 Tax=Marinobacter santoriniensis NKSG1 TaxID=1288826 RepID=M7DIL4_9GAMM|nr:UDP-N-acetylmuramoyl-tripeptide--D-alanyl-D-alanine ligase [Marinobacter santoriniensis]EMP57507.1 UDP-N-acetylmuramoyl-tripeptide--D-alanyl-D-alanine ligase [Marinobacter santoriniensis NKSG1]